MELISAFMIGLAGSFHCIGMCGPIAVSLGGNGRTGLEFILKRIVYNLGRIFSYALLGLVFGFLGDRLSLFGLQRWLSVLIGSVLVLSVFFAFLKFRNPAASKLYGLFTPLFRKLYSKLKSRTSYSSMILTGVMNGFLPCGFVYLGLGAALAIGGSLHGAAYMALFGLGTIPVMLGVAVFGNFFSARFRSLFSKLSPALVLFLGILFILRGLNLGIPFVSPAEQTGTLKAHEEVICH